MNSIRAGHENVKRLTGNVLHHKIEVPVRRSGIVNRYDVRMIERAQNLHLTEKARAIVRTSKGAITHDFDRDFAIGALFQRLVDHALTAPMYLADDVVAGKRFGRETKPWF